MHLNDILGVKGIHLIIQRMAVSCFDWRNENLRFEGLTQQQWRSIFLHRGKERYVSLFRLCRTNRDTNLDRNGSRIPANVCHHWFGLFYQIYWRNAKASFVTVYFYFHRVIFSLQGRIFLICLINAIKERREKEIFKLKLKIRNAILASCHDTTLPVRRFWYANLFIY